MRKLRDECLNGEIFYSLREAQIVIERWRVQYNTKRPHSALGYRPPAPAACEIGRDNGLGLGKRCAFPTFPQPRRRRSIFSLDGRMTPNAQNNRRSAQTLTYTLSLELVQKVGPVKCTARDSYA